MAYQDHETAVARRMVATLGIEKALHFARGHAEGIYFRPNPNTRRHWLQVVRRIKEQKEH